MNKSLFAALLLAISGSLPAQKNAPAPIAPPPPDCQNVFVWTIKADNERAKGQVDDVRKHIQSTLTKIKGCNVLDRERLGTLEEIARTEDRLQHLDDASNRVKNSLKAAKAEMVIFGSVEIAPSGALSLSLSLEEIASTRIVHADSWNLSEDDSRPSRLKAAIMPLVYDLVGAPRPPDLKSIQEDENAFNAYDKMKNFKKKAGLGAEYLDKKYPLHKAEVEKDMRNSLRPRLRQERSEWTWAAITGGVGLGALATGIVLESKAQDQYQVYTANLDPNLPIYAETSREDYYTRANNKHILAQAIGYPGAALTLCSAFLAGRRLYWHKTLRRCEMVLRPVAPPVRRPAVGIGTSGGGVSLSLRF